MKDFLGFGAVILAIVVFILGLVMVIAQKDCLETYQDYQPQWGVWSNCRIVWDGKLTPVDMIKNINLQK